MKFRKKPVVIEAVQFDSHMRPTDWPQGWPLPQMDEGGAFRLDPLRGGLEVKTLEGWLHASEGDWIIRGVKGEFYPCKPDIFAATYEPSDAAPSPSADPGALADAMADALAAGIGAWDSGLRPTREAAINAMLDALHAWERRNDAAPPTAAPAPSQPKVTACQRCKGRGWWEPASDIGNRIKCGACGGTGRAPGGSGRGEEGRDGR